MIKFPFKKVGETSLGMIWRPFIQIMAFSKLKQIWIPIEVLVDTGADYTMFPKKYTEILGIDTNTDCSAITTSGIGGSETVYAYKNLEIKINNWQKQIPVGFLERNDIPAVLGRLKCLEGLELIFKNHQTFFNI